MRRSFDLTVEMLERVKDASAATGISLNGILEEAFEHELERLTAERNGGKPFPHRDESAPGARRMAPRRSA